MVSLFVLFSFFPTFLLCSSALLDSPPLHFILHSPSQQLTSSPRNRASPVGYSVSIVPFSPSTFQPLAPPSSTSALTPIFSNSNTTACPGNCFRPAGLAWDRDGRLYVSSDATGEIYVITKSGGLPVDGARKGMKSTAPAAVGVSVAGVVLTALGTVVVGLW